MTETLTTVPSATDAAATASAWMAATTAEERAGLLRAVADAVDAHSDELVALADAETALGATRLAGEVARTTGQLRLFADVVLDGSYLEAVLDPADPTATPPKPDMRRMLQPLGPVAVFSASNFPFAFSVVGGDTASALAAGCPVVVKAHSGHPRLSVETARVAAEALRQQGAPEGVLTLVSGREAGRELVLDPVVRAVGFTGSTAGGRALFDLASGRPDPIPFYGELGSINPVVVTRRAVERRGQQVAEGLVASFTLGVGQFCTNPGVVLVPQDAGLEALVEQAVQGGARARMLSERIATGFHDSVRELSESGSAEVLAGTPGDGADEASASPVVLTASVDDLLREPALILEERFGPACVLIRYADDQLDAALAELPGSLTTTIHGEEDDLPEVAGLVEALTARSGRVIWNGWPTGVAVNWSQHHGGPWPATTAPLHTSVGATAIRRWLRPVCYQDLPAQLLPPALRDGNPLGIPRREDGRLQQP